MEDALAYAQAHHDAFVEELNDLLRIPSISADPAHAGDVRRAAEWLAADLKTIGFDAAVRDTTGHPMVIAQGAGPVGSPHVLFYGHYDVQPVDPLDLWETDPFAPAVKDLGGGRRIITGRGAQDDKGQLMTFVEACRAWKQAHGTLPCTLVEPGIAQPDLLIRDKEACRLADRWVDSSSRPR